MYMYIYNVVIKGVISYIYMYMYIYNVVISKVSYLHVHVYLQCGDQRCHTYMYIYNVVIKGVISTMSCISTMW